MLGPLCGLLGGFLSSPVSCTSGRGTALMMVGARLGFTDGAVAVFSSSRACCFASTGAAAAVGFKPA